MRKVIKAWKRRKEEEEQRKGRRERSRGKKVIIAWKNGIMLLRRRLGLIYKFKDIVINNSTGTVHSANTSTKRHSVPYITN